MQKLFGLNKTKIILLFQNLLCLIFINRYTELMHWADKELLDKFEWKKETFFCDLYQKVVAVKIKD